MTDTNVIPAEELEYLVRSIRRTLNLSEIGGPAWITQHEHIVRLNQQAHIELIKHQEETVKEYLILHSVLPHLVHELYIVLVWRTKILPRLLAIEPNTNASFMLYSVLFHEATVLSLIECALFHETGCIALGDFTLDLIDYCLDALTKLIGIADVAADEQTDIIEDESTEFSRQQRHLQFKIGIHSISVLCYIVDKLDALPLSCCNRLIQTHDTPCVLSAVLHARPWYRRRHPMKADEKFIDDKWTPVSNNEDAVKLTKTEAQAWLCFRQLMFNPNVLRQYGINEFRQRELAKCQGMLHERLLDQLPPLAEFKHFLCTLQLSGGGSSQKSSSLLLEELPVLKEDIMTAAKRIGFVKIVQDQAAIFLHKSHDETMAMAKQLNSIYQLDTYEWMDNVVEESCGDGGDSGGKCARCKEEATKRCRQCEKTFYCGRQCQVADWPKHKLSCAAKN